MNALAWSITPDALYYGPKGFYERYGKPIVITENGVTVRDAVATDGKVHDPQRIDFTRRYLRSLHRAISEGVKVDGYFHWSVMDNFEWAEGYKERFGLIYVDYATQARTLKESAYWYKDRHRLERRGRDLLAAHSPSRARFPFGDRSARRRPSPTSRRPRAHRCASRAVGGVKSLPTER